MKILFVITISFMLASQAYAKPDESYKIRIRTINPAEEIEISSSEIDCRLNKTSVALEVCNTISKQFPHVLTNTQPKQMFDHYVKNADLEIIRLGTTFPSVVSLDRQTTCDLKGNCSAPQLTEAQQLVFFILRLAHGN